MSDSSSCAILTLLQTKPSVLGDYLRGPAFHHSDWRRYGPIHSSQYTELSCP